MRQRPTPRHRADARSTGHLDQASDPRDGVNTDRPPTVPRNRHSGARGLILVAAAVAVGLVGGLLYAGRSGTPATATAGIEPTAPAPSTLDDAIRDAVHDAVPAVPARPVSPAQLARLPVATTWGVVPHAPLDPTPDQVPSGELVAPTVTVPVYAAPGGPAIAALPAQQLDGNHQPVGQTTVPVIATQPGWARVLLPSKPNSSTGWIDVDNAHIHESMTPWLIRVDREHYTLTLLRSGVPVGHWTVGVGVLRPSDGHTQSVTPTGRTFVVADIRVEHPTYSPVILPLGAHSPIYDSYGGGPATVGIHTWTPSSAVYGHNSSHGCVRVPADALQVLSTQVPIGTPVLIS